MTSELEALKTNEFLRRRKLRIQQVREQSKDIAKKIRQRANVEKFRHLGNIDAAKEREYLEQQDKLVKKLELLYAQGLDNVGTSHRDAAVVSQQEDKVDKTDLSKQRGKEAAAELRRKKQDKLNERNKLLERKLQARETANEISREKASTITSKLSKSSIIKGPEETNSKTEDVASFPVNVPQQTSSCLPNETKDKTDGVTDMATQWEYDALPNEWETHIPVLSLPKDDSVKDSSKTDNKSEKSKRLNLFALSDEMPSSLRGMLSSAQEEVPPNRHSLKLVSEYIQNRDLRLRESDSTSFTKKSNADLQSLKKTIQQTRSLRPEGSLYNPICHVADVQMVPVPSWHAENQYEVPNLNRYNYNDKDFKHFEYCNSAQRNKSFASARSSLHDIQPSPVIRGSSPFRRAKLSPRIFAGKRNSNIEKPTKLVTLTPNSALEKKSSVTMYNHNTRDIQDVPFGDRKVVTRENQIEEDAYSLAMKESSSEVTNKQKERKHRVQQMRNKIAMTKQDVEKEYKDTMAFLNSLPKDRSKPIRNAYKNEQQQQMHKECRQRKLQMEFKKIQKECSKLENLDTESSHKHKVKCDSDDDFNSKDFQYSWMPVPESDGNLAIHTIPTTVKEHKSGNTVKFSKVDSYHEYRSRHQHTPPTKDIPSQEKQKIVEAILMEEDENTENVSSESSSSKNTSNYLHGDTNKDPDDDLSDTERFIIYKIVDKKGGKEKAHKNKKVLKDIVKSMSFIDKDKTQGIGGGDLMEVLESGRKRNRKSKSVENQVSYDKLREGIYKTTKTDTDNITTMYFSDSPRDLNEMRKQGGDNGAPRAQSCCATCGSECTSKRKQKININQPSTSTSTSSFKTATNDKSTAHDKGFHVVDEATAPVDGGFIKFVDQKSDIISDKFYIGATGFLKDDAYEVIIQLRKKDTKVDNQEKPKIGTEKSFDVNIQNVPTIATESEATQKSTYDKKDILVNVEENQTLNTASADEPVVPAIQTPKDDTKVVASSQLETDSATIQQKDSTGQSVSTTNEQVINTIEYNKLHGHQRASNTCDKEVLTPFQDTYAIPSNFSIKDSVIKSTNSISIQTQTTLDSPPHRPVYLMSSSTSTAYLSPPELLLPQFLKNDHKFSCEEDNDSYNMRDPRVKIINREESSEDCDFQSVCSHVRKMSITSTRPSCHSEKRGREHNTIPNTARIAARVQEIDFCKKKRAYVTSLPKKKCRKCEKNEIEMAEADTQTCIHAPKKKSSRLLMRRLNSIASSLARNRSSGKTVRIRQDAKKELHPVLKRYVNKLLSLSKEGLQAIEIVNQNCSAVSTPGSSIVNVPHNINEKNVSEVKISLEHMKETLIQQILEKIVQKNLAFSKDEKVGDSISKNSTCNVTKQFTSKKRSLHKVKSLNISRNLFPKNKSSCPNNTIQNSIPTSATSSSRDQNSDIKTARAVRKPHKRSKSSPSPRGVSNERHFSNDVINSEKSSKDFSKSSKKVTKVNNVIDLVNHRKSSEIFRIIKVTPPKSCEAMVTPSDLEPKKKETEVEPLDISTQTSRVIDDEINFMKLAENKLQNIEKIADLTEKCTQRLSNLAKVLDEVRRNKSLAYSQGSEEASDSDRVSGKNSDPQLATTYEPVIEIKEKGLESPIEPVTISAPPTTPEELDEPLPCPSTSESVSDAISFINIVKPIKKRPKSPLKTAGYRVRSPTIAANLEHHNIKTRGKPPPALSRRCLKNSPEYIMPHELSTVIEVDSPQLKSQPECNEENYEIPNNGNKNKEQEDTNEKLDNNPDILQSSEKLSASQTKIANTESCDESKVQMMDLKQFNEIMLKPFISIDEYAKQCNVETLEEGSKIEVDTKDDVITDDLSSLHSDGSLPDVIAELLKRNIISEPFKFDTGSNANSTTISSESTLSGLALSKAKKDKRSNAEFNKENIAESSDTLSISSNPDLENAFKKLGMGWASSTLKKTKERLALSSSSNTSSSSLSQQFKLKSVNIQEFPAIVADSVFSVNKSTRLSKVATDSIKNAEQQTSMTNSMTVKQFLTNELAKRITFTNKSHNDDTMEEEFVSLYETKMPEEMKHSSKLIREERSVDSNPRARTSTPVQIFKSMTYHSSSSSNISNGLFSNADELSSVKGTSNSLRNHSTSDKDDLTIPNFSLRTRKGLSDCSKSD